jgi:hypothetical protein
VEKENDGGDISAEIKEISEKTGIEFMKTDGLSSQLKFGKAEKAIRGGRSEAWFYSEGSHRA